MSLDGGVSLMKSLSRMRWRLKAHARHRLALDIAILCTGLRVAVLVDYAREASQLAKQLVTLLDLLAQESRIVSSLHVMCMDDDVYLIHKDNLTTYVDETLNGLVTLKFVLLDGIAAQFLSSTENREILDQLAIFREHFLGSMKMVGKDNAQHNEGSSSEMSSSSLCFFDMGSSQACYEAPLPTLNGWLLGYPVIYTFKKETASKAVQALSLSTLHHYKVLLQSSVTFQTLEICSRKARTVLHELTSFTVPSELSPQGADESWAASYMASLQPKVKNSQVWKSLELQVTSQVCQSVVL